MSNKETIYVSPKMRRLRVNLKSSHYEHVGNDKVLKQGVSAQFEDGLFKTADAEVIELMDANGNNTENGNRGFFTKVKDVNAAQSELKQKTETLEQREAKVAEREAAIAEKEAKLDKDEAGDDEGLVDSTHSELKAILKEEAEAKGAEVTSADKKTKQATIDAIIRVRATASAGGEFED
ncbi:hypothetical protein KAU11_10280 [Candidatus Babeliales bacterium]|nr:hypothetical protein [Candidatus Babeliales bacterium]